MLTGQHSGHTGHAPSMVFDKPVASSIIHSSDVEVRAPYQFFF